MFSLRNDLWLLLRRRKILTLKNQDTQKTSGEQRACQECWAFQVRA